MNIVLTIIGVLFGSQFADGMGAIPGGLLGYLLATVLTLNKKVIALEQSVAQFGAQFSNHKKVEAGDTPASATSVAASAPVKPYMPPEIVEQEIRTATPVVMSAERNTAEVSARMRQQAVFEDRSDLPDLLDSKVVKYIKNYFSGPNILARVGIIILFFGVAFLLKYAAERSEIPVEFKLMAVAMAAIAMLVFGWRLRVRKPDYALVMQGGSIGVLYLTIFTALRMYQALPAGLALVILIAVGVFSAVLAVVQNARSLAILGICGGFLAPILTSTGGGSHIVLFSYYALLNAGIFGMAWFKAWRPLNLLGFFFTFVIGIAWGVTKYDSSQYLSSQFFLILFFLFYVGISILFALRQAPQLKNYVDGTLVFGTPLISFGLQAGMMQQSVMLQQFEYGLAVSAVVLSFIYLSTAKILFDRKRDNLRLLVESFLALGVVFATLAIPMALDGRWTSASWALEGAAILWMGVRQNRLLPRVSGMLLQLGAGLALLLDFNYAYDAWPLLNSHYIDGMLLATAGLFCAWYLQHNKARVKAFEYQIAYVLFVWGVLWWLGTGLREIDRFVAYEYYSLAHLLFFACSAAVFSYFNKYLDWSVARIPALGFMPVLVIIALSQWLIASHPFINFGYIGWITAFALSYWILHRHESELPISVAQSFHTGLLWLLIFVLSWESSWAINYLVQGQGVWPLIAWAIVPGLVVGGLSLYAKQITWPVAKHLTAYLGMALMPVALYLWLWTLFSNVTSDGNPYPIQYLPILNPLDLAQLFVFIVLVFWLLTVRPLKMSLFSSVSFNALYAAIAAAVFIWLNAVLLRSLHYWAYVPFDYYAMKHSLLVQASISIFWSVMALLIMRFATHKQLRKLWIVGGVLMAAVVIKLFTIDISGIGSLARIISFIGVAVLMLIMGYIAPIPTGKAETNNA